MFDQWIFWSVITIGGGLILIAIVSACKKIYKSKRKIEIILEKYEPKCLIPDKYQWYLAFTITNKSPEIRYIDKDHFYYTNENDKDRLPTILPIIHYPKYPIKIQENESCKIELIINYIGEYRYLNSIYIVDTKKRIWNIEKDSLKEFKDKTQKFFNEYKTINDDYEKRASLR